MNGKCQGIGFPKPRWPVSHELAILCCWVRDGETPDEGRPGGTAPAPPPHQGQGVSDNEGNLLLSSAFEDQSSCDG